MDVQALALENESTTIGSDVDNLSLTDLPDGLVDGIDVGGDRRDVLNGTTR